MPGLITNTGRTALLKLRLGQQAAEDLVLKLFVNDRLPTRGDAASDYQEPVGQGYHAVRLLPANFRVQPATEDGAAVATYPTVTFVFNGPLPDPLRGYFLVGMDTGDLHAVQRFDTDRPVQHLGDEEQVTVSLVQK